MQVNYRNIWNMSYPILVCLLMQQLIGITDVVFLGRLGEVELGAAALGSTYFFTIFMVAFGFSNGAQIIMARRNGEQNYADIGPVFYQGCSFLMISGIMFILLSYICTPCILKFLIDSPQIYQATLDYVNWRMWGLLTSSLIVMERSFFVSITKTSVLTIVSLVMVSTNIVLNYMLIFGNFGAPRLEISGAAIASDLSEAIAVLAYIVYFIFKVDLKKYGFTNFVYRNFKLLKSILDVSVWTMLQQFISVSTWFLFFIAIEHLGERELAISNIIKSLYSFIFVLINAFASAVSSIVSNLIGEDKSEEVIPATNKVLILSTLVTMPLLLIMILLPYPLIRIYTDNIELVTQSIPSLISMVLSNSILIPGWIYLCAVLGTGNTKYTMKIEFFAMIVYVLHILIVIEYLRLSLPICWTADAVYNIAILIFAYRYMYSYEWCNKKV